MPPEVREVVGIIPARYGSRRLPGKPLIDLCGKSMIQRVYERATRATLVNRVIVATDDSRVRDVVEGFGGEVIMTPSELKSGTDRIALAARNLNTVDIVVNIQGDEPLIAPEMIDEAVSMVIRDQTIRVGTLVKRLGSAEELNDPGVVKVVLDRKGDSIFFSRSPIPYYRDVADTEWWVSHHPYLRHIGLYVFRQPFLLEYSSWEESTLEKAEQLEQLRILYHGYQIRASVTTYDSIPVDTPEDAEKLRQILMQDALGPKNER